MVKNCDRGLENTARGRRQITNGILDGGSFSISFYHETKFFNSILYSIYIYMCVYEYIYICYLPAGKSVW